MKFYLIEIATGDSRIAGKSVYEYATSNEAIANFHSKLGTAMKSNLFTTELVVVIDSFGTVIKKEYWSVPVAENEPADEVVAE